MYIFIVLDNKQEIGKGVQKSVDCGIVIAMCVLIVNMVKEMKEIVVRKASHITEVSKQCNKQQRRGSTEQGW